MWSYEIQLPHTALLQRITEPWAALPGARPTKHISIEFEIRWKFKTLWCNIYAAYHNYILHTSRQWRVQNIVVIGRVYSKLERSEFSSNFEFDRNMLSGTGARTIGGVVVHMAEISPGPFTYYTEMEMMLFWWNVYHWLHWKLSKWQIPVQPVIKICQNGNTFAQVYQPCGWRGFLFDNMFSWSDTIFKNGMKSQVQTPIMMWG